MTRAGVIYACAHSHKVKTFLKNLEEKACIDLGRLLILRAHTNQGDKMTGKRSAERVEFLSDVLTTAVEGGIQYWADVLIYEVGPETYATIADEDGEYNITIDTIAHGISVLTTGENRGHSFTMSGMDYWKQFLLANRTNGEDGDYDADIADNILQAGIFGRIVYG
jgi:hypothetical protein